MTVEILYFEGCRGFERLLPTVRDLAQRCGAQVVVRAVETVEAAEADRFLGSPTVRVNGEDVEPGAAARDDFGLKCRIYRTRDGQSDTPPTRWITAALGASSG